VPVSVACEIVTDAVPVFVRVSVWELLEPVVTFPKVRLVALAANDPEEAVVEFALAAGVPAPVNPVQPDIDRAAKRTTIIVSEVGGVR
jgi:hypothetical protein